MGCGIREKGKLTKALRPTESLSHMTTSLLSLATCWDLRVGVLRWKENKIKILAAPLSCCVTSGEPLYLSVP